MTRRRWWILALLTMVPTVGLLVWLNRPGVLHFPVQQVVLTNGTTLQLVSVQVGRVHTDPFSPPWQQWAARLPDNLTRRFKANLPRTLAFASTNAVLSVWLSASKAPAMMILPCYGVLIGDDEGNFAGDGRGRIFATGKTPSIVHYEAHSIPIFPRRARELRIRIYDNSGLYDQFLHEFRIPNPNPISTEALPPLVAQALPQSQTSGDLEATLMSLRASSDGSPFVDPNLPKIRLEFTMRQADQPTTNWVAYRVLRLWDATGNKVNSNRADYGWKKGRAYVAFSEWPLPVTEPWRMEVEFRQRYGFASNELWEVRKIPIEKPGTSLTPITNRLHGTEVRIARLGRPYSGNSGDEGKRAVGLSVVADAPPDQRRWQLTIAKAIDSTGLDVTANDGLQADKWREFDLQVSSNATYIDVWIAYAPSRVLEFIAQPTLNPEPAGTNPQPRP
jgi:hypothetical protein